MAQSAAMVVSRLHQPYEPWRGPKVASLKEVHCPGTDSRELPLPPARSPCTISTPLSIFCCAPALNLSDIRPHQPPAAVTHVLVFHFESTTQYFNTRCDIGVGLIRRARGDFLVLGSRSF